MAATLFSAVTLVFDMSKVPAVEESGAAISEHAAWSKRVAVLDTFSRFINAAR
jgi:hypothetical protein